MHACQHGRVEIVELLLQKGAKVNMKNRAGETALMFAAKFGCVQACRLLLDKRADVNAQTKNEKFTALMMAVMNDKYYTAELLLAQPGINKDAQTAEGNTALMIAVCLYYKGIVRLLLEYKVNTSLRNNKGEAACDIAKKKAATAFLPYVRQNFEDMEVCIWNEEP
jgi:ankyrin repeat protein